MFSGRALTGPLHLVKVYNPESAPTQFLDMDVDSLALPPDIADVTKSATEERNEDRLNGRG